MKLPRRVKEFITLIVLASVMGFLMCPKCFDSFEYIWKMEAIMITIWTVMWYGNEFVSRSIDHYISWLVNPAKRYALGLIGAAVFSTIAILSLAFLFKALFNVSIGNDWQLVWITIGVSLIILLFMLSKEFLYSWRELALREEKIRSELMLSKFETLKSQLNPHFMFNSLTALSSLVYEDQDLAVKYINQLSKVFRYVLDAGKQEAVSLKNELDVMEAYIFLQKIRFGPNFVVEQNIDESQLDKMVAPLVIQMLLENAIKHNEISQANPLIVKIYNDDRFLTIENQIHYKEVMKQDSTNVGLENIRSRYEVLSDQPIEIVEDKERFMVKVPLLSQVT